MKPADCPPLRLCTVIGLTLVACAGTPGAPALSQPEPALSQPAPQQPIPQRRAAATDSATPAAPNFEGLWETSFGRLRLVRRGDGVIGVYGPGGGGWLEGRVEAKDGGLRFNYSEPGGVSGEGVFYLGDDGHAFAGRWRERGETDWRGWRGRRTAHETERAWLVVLEADWGDGLDAPDYSFAAMLDAFFARVPNVSVRRRKLESAESLERWSREIALLEGEVVVVIASHGTEEGLSLGSEPVPVERVAAALRRAPNIRLLHFSACLMMTDRQLSASRKLATAIDAPVSGYATSVDWAQSALIEMMMLELVLARGIAPSAAVAATLRMMPIAGAGTDTEAPLPPAQLRMVTPQANKPVPGR